MFFVLQGQVALTSGSKTTELQSWATPLDLEGSNYFLISEGGFFDTASVLTTTYRRSRTAVTWSDVLLGVLTQEALVSACETHLDDWYSIQHELTNFQNSMDCSHISSSAQEEWIALISESKELLGEEDLGEDWWGMSLVDETTELTENEAGATRLGLQNASDGTSIELQENIVSNGTKHNDLTCRFCESKQQLLQCQRQPNWIVCSKGDHQNLLETHKELCGCELVVVRSDVQQLEDAIFEKATLTTSTPDLSKRQDSAQRLGSQTQL